ncbi:MAG: shikimate dehydrogenase [Fusobacteria bacterium]|nr:shikimate dehydrogenase [Fusobacteriota bacterium]
MNKFGLLGGNLSHSKSPILHEIIMKTANILGEYILFEAKTDKEVNDVLVRVKGGEIKGLNVTIPHKERVIPFLDDISEAAKSIGAINVVVNVEGKLVGHNTDYEGFRATVCRMSIPLVNENVFVLGAGGAAKAVVKALLDECAHVILVTRDVEKAKKSFTDFESLNFITYNELLEEKGTLIVNCTPCGMIPNNKSSAVTAFIVDNFPYVIDIVYNPYTTLFMSYASKTAKVENGLYMLVVQAIRAQEIWNDVKIECVEEVYQVMKTEYLK